MNTSVSISASILTGLLTLQRYRLLSVEQFSRTSCLKPSHIREVLRVFERKKLLGSIGNVGLRGGSKAPKLYHLNRSGYNVMLEAGGLCGTVCTRQYQHPLDAGNGAPHCHY